VSVLEQSYLIFRLPPYHRNLGKRIIKSPKLYFYDTGLLCYLLGMQQEQDVQNYYQLGALFENLIIAEVTKRAAHAGQPGRFFFYRDSNQVEVDLLEEKGNQTTLTEIKAARTVFSKQLKGLNRVQQLIKDQPVDLQLIYGGEESGFSFQEVTVKSWQDL
jgi:predicted AAA+ superfamily ATPase